MQDVADAQLSQIADAALGDDGGAPVAPSASRPEPERVEEPERRVLEPREVVRHGEVVDVVDFPAVHGSRDRSRSSVMAAQHPTVRASRAKALGQRAGVLSTLGAHAVPD